MPAPEVAFAVTAGPLEFRVPFAAPRVVLVTPAALAAYLGTRGVTPRRSVPSAVEALRDALSPAAQRDDGLTADDATMVIGITGSIEAVKLLPELARAFREAQEAVDRAVAALAAEAAPRGVFAADGAAAPRARGEWPPPPEGLSVAGQRERALMIAALEAEKYNLSAAATRLGMPRRTFYRRLAEYALTDAARRTHRRGGPAGRASRWETAEAPAPAPATTPEPAPKRAAAARPRAKAKSR